MLAEGRLLERREPDFQSVSFIIPAHNEQKYLAETIRSLQAAIAELKIEAEIIVVNDGSTDETGALARRMQTVTLDVNLRNIGAVRNAGATMARHPWLIFVDADTTVPAETIRRSLLGLAQGDAGGGARVEINDGQPLFWVKRLMYLAVVLIWQVIGGWAAGCYMFCRKDLFEEFGGFDEQYFAAEEYFFSRQLKRRGRFRLVRFPVSTSARKLHQYSTWELIRFISVPLLNFRGLFTTKTGLEILYEDAR